jgi:hypothetical protein
MLTLQPTSPAHPDNACGQAADGHMESIRPESLHPAIPAPSDTNRGKMGTKRQNRDRLGGHTDGASRVDLTTYCVTLGHAASVYLPVTCGW